MESGHTSDYLRMVTEAAEGGLDMAIEELGFIYDNGIGVEKDVIRAAAYYAEAFRRGRKSAVNEWFALFSEIAEQPDSDTLLPAAFDATLRPGSILRHLAPKP